MESVVAKLYEDKYSSAITDSAFLILAEKNEQERIAKTERLNVLLPIVEKVRQNEADIQNWSAIIRKYLSIQELNREIVDELIERIEIGESYRVDGKRQREIKVFYRFVGWIE